ncbi:xylulokinase [Alkalispirochaeta americana]|uniref:Xylulokinase n=1 Tax=Alkalispirochaeta americana TaxID=159291 RepID=A0A1N6U3B1_9SPIO|nr:FGGY family carbohydrate kinase [Alkalispirochaeta americana]SIQ60039.1 xylulokinase [Alkalispirochaeta americana]
MTDSILIGIDIGTSSVKVCVLQEDRGVLGEGQASYVTVSPRPGWAEQDPEAWWKGTLEALGEALHKARDGAGRSGRALEIKGIGVTGQMHSFVLLDKNHQVLRPAVTWMDSRAKALVPEVLGTLERHGMEQRVMNAPAPGLTALPLLWLARTEPEVFSRASVLLTAKDYIRFRLTGHLASDPTDASATLLFDVPGRVWLENLQELFGFSGDILPPLQDSWVQGGALREELFSAFGVNRPVPVAQGCGDQQAAALATGMISPGVIQMMLGTGGQISSPLARCPRTIPEGLNLFCHHRDWLVQGSVQNAGSALAWVQGVLGASWLELEEAARTVQAGRGGHDVASLPFFVPYLTGERSPVMAPEATGSWRFLRQSTSREDLLYAALEGVVFSLTGALAKVREIVFEPSGDFSGEGRVRLGGGGTRSEAYVQLLCDSLGEPLTVLSEMNSTARGAALLGGVAAGCYSSLEEGVRVLAIKPERVVYPRLSRTDWLRERREAGKRIAPEWHPGS